MFDETTMNININKALEFHVEGVDRYFTNIENNIIYMYRGSLQDFYWKKGTHEILDVPCVHFNVEIIQMRKYLISILKQDTPSEYRKEKIDHWLDYLKKSQTVYYYANSIIQLFIS